MTDADQDFPFHHHRRRTEQRVKHGEYSITPDGAPEEDNNLIELLPAAVRTPNDDLRAVGCESTDILSFLDSDLSLERLSDIHDLLWIVGRPMPPRPLHYQRLLTRSIAVTQRMDQHLVWGDGVVFMKPLPEYLLSRQFWEKYLPWTSSASDQNSAELVRRCRAIGFLFSYAALIPHKIDFQIAQANFLIPEDLQWQDWRELVHELVGHPRIYSLIDRRFHYGELRLSRLNKLYFFWETPLRRYKLLHTQYGSFLGANFAWLASLIVYVALVLTAMQLGVGTDLKDNKSFMAASYGFAIFAILGPLVFVSLLILWVIYLLINNWAVTVRYHDRRMKAIRERS